MGQGAVGRLVSMLRVVAKKEPRREAFLSFALSE